MTDQLLKTVEYEAAGKPNHKGKVSYAILEGSRCVFAGITRNSTSTILAAEEIIATICALERVSPELMTFYDLQTKMQYGKKDGEFEFDVIEFTYTPGANEEVGIISNVGWTRALCPEDVKSLFAEHIGENPRQR